MRSSRALRELLAQEEILIAPGTHDPLTARIIEQVGFDLTYMTGYGSSLSQIGYPDVGLMTMPEMVTHAKNIQERIDIPLIADADTGYGNATNVIRTVREFIKAGVAGIQLEDQTFPKRCGSLSGKRTVPRDEMIGKIHAALEARKGRDDDLVIVARSDARGAVDGNLDEAIERVNAYCEAGADIGFVAGMTNEEELELVGAEVDASLLYETPLVGPRVDSATLSNYGFDIVVYPLVATQATVASVFTHMQAIKEDGIDAVVDLESRFEELPIEGEVSNARDLFHVFSGINEIREWEEKFLPEDDIKKYDESIGASISQD